jgi:hypothetical protein
VYAVFAAVLQVVLPALVPPLTFKVILLEPLVSNEVRIFSIDCAVNAQPAQELWKAPEIRVPVVLNRLAGNVANEEQPNHAYPTLVALE